MPFLKQFPSGYYWSLMQVEYSWDLFSWKRAADLAPVYAEISRQAILTVKAPDVAKFLGKRLSPEAELTSDFRTRIEGTRIRHPRGPAALKTVRQTRAGVAPGMRRQRRQLLSNTTARWNSGTERRPIRWPR